MVSNASHVSLTNIYLLKIPLQSNILVDNNINSLMYQLYPGLQDVDLEMGYLRSLPHTPSLNFLQVPNGSLSVLAPNERLRNPLLMPLGV